MFFCFFKNICLYVFFFINSKRYFYLEEIKVIYNFIYLGVNLYVFLVLIFGCMGESIFFRKSKMFIKYVNKCYYDDR